MGHYAEAPRRLAQECRDLLPAVQRWASEGMPLRRQGRYVETTSDELNAWLGKESGKPVHVATEDTDLTAELKRGLSFLRHEKPSKPPRKKAKP
jgi:hypothetical protein